MNSTTESPLMDIFFQQTPCLSSHVYALKASADQYLHDLQLICETGTFAVVSSGVRARILAALHISSKHNAVEMLLKHCDATDIAKALTLLDRPRKARQLQHKIQKIKNSHPGITIHNLHDNEQEQEKQNKKRKTSRKIDLYHRENSAIESQLRDEGDHSKNDCETAHADTAVKEMVQSASVSGALARKVRNWAKTYLTSDFLEFVMLALPSGPWHDLADLVHFHPNDFAVPYFLFDVHRSKSSKSTTNESDVVPQTSFVYRMRELVAMSNDVNKNAAEIPEQFINLAKDFPQVYLNYSFIRTQKSLMSYPAVVEQLAMHVPLDTAVWYFEELFAASRACEKIIAERIKGSGDIHRSIKSKATYGKLVERILTFRRMNLSFADDIIPIAGARLEELQACWNWGVDMNVAVFGDASSSMQLAIETATIFAGMVSVCFNGELSFFASNLVKSPHKKPANVHETLDICSKIRARGCTSLASALWPYYEERKKMDMFVLVTDEEENTPWEGYCFADLLAEYKRTVNENVTLIIVCVGGGCRSFRESLVDNDIEYRVITIDESRPDLTKFDALLGQLAIFSRRGTVDEKIQGEIMDDSEEFVVV